MQVYIKKNLWRYFQGVQGNTDHLTCDIPKYKFEFLDDLMCTFDSVFSIICPSHTLQGNTGVLLGMLLVSLVVLVALVTVMSGIGVCEHCGIGGGGIYSMISTVLGGRVGGTVGLLYVFGQVRYCTCVFLFFLFLF